MFVLLLCQRGCTCLILAERPEFAALRMIPEEAERRQERAGSRTCLFISSSADCFSVRGMKGASRTQAPKGDAQSDTTPQGIQRAYRMFWQIPCCRCSPLGGFGGSALAAAGTEFAAFCVSIWSDTRAVAGARQESGRSPRWVDSTAAQRLGRQGSVFLFLSPSPVAHSVRTRLKPEQV